MRPATLGAESAHVGDDFGDFVVCELVAERRHHAIEGARGTALMNHRVPIQIGFRRGETAVREVGRLDLEASNGEGLATPIGGVTRRACGLVQLLAVQAGAIGLLRIEVHVQDQERNDRRDERHHAATVAWRFRSAET